MSIEAMKMALETLENTTDFVPVKSGLEREINNAIQALRQAIEQAEQGNNNLNYPITEINTSIKQAEKQETLILDRGCYERGCVAYDERDGDAINIKQERVDETAKREHEPVEMFKHWSLNWLVGKYYGTYISNGISRIHIWNEPTGRVSPREIDAGWKDGDDFDHTESLEDYKLAVRICEALNAPPKREWQNLTDDEIKEIVGPWGETPIKGYTRKLFDQIEAKLKEKNT